MLLRPTSNLRNSFWLVVFLLVLVSANRSQIAGGMNETTATRLGGNNYLTGTVYSPAGRPISVRMGIRLSSPTAGDYIITTDDRGQFVFSGLVAGTYSIVIDHERDFEAVSQTVDIIQSRNASPQTYMMTVQLIDRRTTDRKPGVINNLSADVPKEASVLYRKALDLAKAGDHEAAIEQLRLAVYEYPKFTLALNEIGVQFLKLNQLEKADLVLQLALKIDHEAYEPLMNRGIALFRLKRYVESESSLRSALKVNDTAVGHYCLGRTLTGLKRYDDAEKELNSALELGGDAMNEAHRMLASMYIAKGDNRRAAEQLKEYLKLVPGAADAEHLRQVILELKRSPSPPPNPAQKPGPGNFF